MQPDQSDARYISNNQSDSSIDQQSRSSPIKSNNLELLFYTEAVQQYQNETVQNNRLLPEEITLLNLNQSHTDLMHEKLNQNNQFNNIRSNKSFSETFVNNVLNSLKAEIDEKRETAIEDLPIYNDDQTDSKPKDEEHTNYKSRSKDVPDITIEELDTTHDTSENLTNKPEDLGKQT